MNTFLLVVILYGIVYPVVDCLYKIHLEKKSRPQITQQHKHTLLE